MECCENVSGPERLKINSDCQQWNRARFNRRAYNCSKMKRHILWNRQKQQQNVKHSRQMAAATIHIQHVWNWNTCILILPTCANSHDWTIFCQKKIHKSLITCSLAKLWMYLIDNSIHVRTQASAATECTSLASDRAICAHDILILKRSPIVWIAAAQPDAYSMPDLLVMDEHKKADSRLFKTQSPLHMGQALASSWAAKS